MSEFRRRLLMRQGEIPYQQIEYLQSDSSAYIDTGIVVNDHNYEIDITFAILSYVYALDIFNNYVDLDTNTTRCLCGSNTALWCNFNSNVSNNYTNVPYRLNTKINLTYKKEGIYLNGKFYSTFSNVSALQNTNSIVLFNRPIAQYKGGASSKIYSFKISKIGEVLRDFVPVRIGNVGYMYDKVSKQLFGNIGSGQFILGQDI